MVKQSQAVKPLHRREEQRQGRPEDYPWVVEVSEDRRTWLVRDLAGELSRTRKINLGITLEDGSGLTDEVNREFFETAVAYLQIVRLYMPQLTAETHRGRVVAMLTFLYWLKQRHVDSLADVTRDHIELYAEGAVFGKEWTVGAPARLIGYMQEEARKGRKLPRAKGNVHKLDHAEIMTRAGIFWPSLGHFRWICKKILKWVEEHQLEVDTEATPEELIATHGWKPQPQTVQSIHRALLPIDELWIWKEHFLSPVLSSNPFPKGAMIFAERKGREPQTRATIPTAIAFPYLRWALKWVLDFGPIILEGRKRGTAMEEVLGCLEEAGLGKSQARRLRAGTNHAIRLVWLLSAACFVVIAALSARRLGEITNLGAGCTYKDVEDRCWIRIYIEKTLQDYDQVPIPEAVRKAVLCMEQVSENARLQSGNDTIWQYQSRRGKRSAIIRPQNHLNRLAELMEHEPGNKQRWSFSPHQFRRFFAMVYFWRYENGDVAALSHHLRHFELEMTRRYVTDRDFGRMWSNAEKEWQGDFLRSVIAGTRAVGGVAGQRISTKIEALKKQFRKDVEVVQRERIADRLLRLAKRWGSSCRLHVWGTICVCPERGTRKAARHAKCRGAEEVGPIFSQASEETCASCPFAIHTERFVQHVKDAQASRETLTAGLSEGALIRNFAQNSIEGLDQALARRAMMPVGTTQQSGTSPGRSRE